MWQNQSFGGTAMLFDRFFPGYGKAVDLSEGDSPLRAEAHMARRIASLYWPPEYAASIGFGFDCVVYDSYEPNAFSAFQGDEHWTGMSTSMVYVLAELAVRVAAVFPIEVPDEPPVDLEHGLSAGFRYDRSDFGQSQAEADRFFRQTRSFGPLRKRLVNTLWLDCQVLVWRHELFHATLGHTRFLQTRFGIASLTEAPRSSVPAAEDRDLLRISRALEFHADWAAFGSVLKMATSNHDAAGIDLQRRLGGALAGGRHDSFRRHAAGLLRCRGNPRFAGRHDASERSSQIVDLPVAHRRAFRPRASRRMAAGL